MNKNKKVAAKFQFQKDDWLLIPIAGLLVFSIDTFNNASQTLNKDQIYSTSIIISIFCVLYICKAVIRSVHKYAKIIAYVLSIVFIASALFRWSGGACNELLGLQESCLDINYTILMFPYEPLTLYLWWFMAGFGIIALLMPTNKPGQIHLSSLERSILLVCTSIMVLSFLLMQSIFFTLWLMFALIIPINIVLLTGAKQITGTPKRILLLYNICSALTIVGFTIILGLPSLMN